MKEYFTLQIKMTNRSLKDFGLNPLLGYFLLFAGFVGFSILLFSKTEFARYLYILIALSIAAKLSETNRNDFLKGCFKHPVYQKLRFIENLIVTLPFIVYLFYEQLYLSIILLTFLTSLMALINFNSTYYYTLPTPFYNKPFEFTVGFRNTFYLFIFAFFLTLMAVIYDNFNLGVFALLLVFLVSISFYSKLENEYYIWTFDDTPKSFLINKIKTAIVHSTMLAIPILMVLVLFFFSEIYILIVFLLLGYLYLVTIILAKYSAYPYEMNLPQGILVGISLLFPPIIIAIALFFYIQSIKRLNDILV